MIQQFAIASIIGYQRYLSPLKGFCCAYRHETGKNSCSAYALRVVRRKGALALFTALPRQFARCREAYQQYLFKKHTSEQESLPEKCLSGIVEEVISFEACECGGSALSKAISSAASSCDCCGCDVFSC